MKKLNKKARFNYILSERLEVGLVLTGMEVKAIKKGGIDLSNSYVKIMNMEAYLINANISAENKNDYNPTRTRKVLMHKKEIISIKTKIKAKKLTIIPTKVYTKGRLIKLEIALAKPKKKFEKRESIKKKDIERDIELELREKKGNTRV